MTVSRSTALSGPDGVRSLLTIALSVVAGGALLLGFVGLALLALHRQANTEGRRS